MNPYKLYCVLCDKEAITTAAHIPVCEEHYTLYTEEAQQYLPFDQRVFYQKLLKAYFEKESKSVWPKKKTE